MLLPHVHGLIGLDCTDMFGHLRSYNRAFDANHNVFDNAVRDHQLEHLLINYSLNNRNNAV